MALDTQGLQPLDTSGLTPDEEGAPRQQQGPGQRALDIGRQDLDTSGMKPLDTSGLQPAGERTRSGGLLSGVSGGFSRGFGQGAQGVEVTAEVLGGADPEQLAETIAERNRAEQGGSSRLQSIQGRIQEAAEPYQGAWGEGEYLRSLQGTFHTIWETGKEFANDPVAFAEFTAQALGTSTVPIGAMVTGGILGSQAGPWGSAAGTIGGGFAGSAALEFGLWVQEEVTSRVAAAGGDPANPQQVAEYLQDDEFREEILTEARNKGLTHAAIGALIDRLSMGLLRFAPKGGAGAAGTKIAAGTGQVASEGLEELGSQVVATGDYDVADVALETAGGLGAGVSQTIILDLAKGGKRGAEALRSDDRGEGETETEGEGEGETEGRSEETPEGVPEGAVRGETLIGQEEDVGAPLGEREKAQTDAEPLSEDDVASPIPSDLIHEGKQTVQDAIGEHSASQILEQAEFPPINSRINLTADDGSTIGGTVIDAFQTEEGAQGAKIELDSGRVISEPFEALQGRVTPTEEAPDAGEVRGDAGPVQGRGAQRPGGEVEGRPDLQRPTQEGAEAGDRAAQAPQGRAAQPEQVAEAPSQAPSGAAREPISRRDVEGDQGRDTAVTSTGRRVPVRYAVVEAADLAASQRDDGRVNPDYPAELQPRDRSRAVSGAQINDILNPERFDPRILDRSPQAHTGAPIVAEDGVVESGNGRILALRKAYREGRDVGETYRNYLAEQGYPVEGLNQPVLVRVREGEMEAGERAAFTREANERDTLGMSATERAMADAAALDDRMLDLYEGGDVDAAVNRPFVRAFLDQIVGRNEQAGMIAADGSMSQEAIRRIEAALLAKAYGNADLVASLVESPDTNIKAVGGALMDVSAAWAQMRSEAAAGDIEPAMDQTANLLEAVRLIQRARRERRSIAEFVGQRDILSGRTVDPVAEGFLRLMFRNTREWTRPAGRDKIRETLQFYLNQARRAQPGVDLLGETAPEPGRILEAARERQYGDEEAAEQQEDLLAQPAGRPGERDRPGGEGRAERPEPDAEETGEPAPARAGEEGAEAEPDLSEEAVRTRRRRDRAFKETYQHLGDPHPEGIGQQVLRGWLDAESGRAMDESRIAQPTAEMRPDGFNPVDYYRSAYVSRRLGEPTQLRALDETPAIGGPGFQSVSLEEARSEIEAAGGTVTSTGTRGAFRPGSDEQVETEFFRIELRQADGMPVRMDNISFPVARMDLDRWLEIPNRTGRPAGLGELGGAAPAQPQATTAQERRNQAQHDIYARRLEDIEDPADLRAYAEELRTALMTDERTGLGSNRAWLNRTPKAHIASIDLDSLKWVNDNMGHDAGDRLIEVVGDAFREAGISDDAFHVSGDEFYVHSEDEQRLRDAMERASEYLRGVTIEGSGLRYTGPAFSYGIGTSIERAEDALHGEKTAREEAGERAARGERPRGVAEPAPVQEQEPAPGDREEAPEARPGERAERPEPDVGAEAADDETQRLARHFADALAGDRAFRSISEARREAGEVLGRTIEPGTQDAKRVDEAVELGVVMRSRSIAGEEVANPRQAYQRLVDLYGRMPNLSTRTSTSVAQQAYSTPIPLSYLAAQAAGITQRSRVYEPSAGNGALLITARPANVLANELNHERAANLDATLPGATVTRNDAAEWSPSGQYDVVIGNPPFGPVKDESGRTRRFQVNDRYETAEIDHAIALKALDAMADDGSAVLLVGSVAKTARSEDARSDAYNGKAKREFYLTLYGEYNVVDHFTVAGELYEKQGAGWPVDVIVIRGRGPSDRRVPAANPPRVYESWDDLAEVLDAQYPVPAPRARTPDRGRDRGRAEPGPGDGRDRSDRGAARPGRERGEPAPGEPADVREGPVGRQPGDARPAEPQPREPARPAEGERPAGRPRRDPVTVEGENLRQVSYQPSSTTTSMGTLVPVNMQTSVQSALDGLRERVGDIDHYVATELGYQPGELSRYFGAEQIDAIALALNNIAKGSGYIVGDQTGLGKGRVVAAILRHALRSGRTPIFVTEKPNLYGDMYRDLADIGVPEMLGHKPRILMTNAAQTVPLDEAGTVLKTGSAASHNRLLSSMTEAGRLDEHEMVFTTYSQMQTLKGETTPRMQFLEAMGRNGIVVFDESHNAGGSVQPGPAEERGGQQQEMNRAVFARNLARSAHGVLYSSATYAKRPEVMDLYATTDMRLAVSDISNLAEAIQKGGVPMQQVVASMLSESGQYLRRERSFDGVTYNAPVVQVPRETYGQYSGALARIQDFSERIVSKAVKALDKEMKAQGKAMSPDGATGGAGAASTNFTSIMHNLIDQMLLAIKADVAADRAIEAIGRGEKPVITVANTMGSFIHDYAEDLGIRPGDRVDLTFNALLERYLVRTRWISVRRPFMKKGEKGERKYLTDEEIGPSGVRAFNEVREMIRSMDLSSMPVSPIDHIRMRLQQAGHSIGEITGRTATIDYRTDGNYYRARPGKEVSIAGRRKSIASFNSGEMDAMIINQAGSTGLSLHASETFQDQRKRRMILAQAEKNIDTHMQMLGRVHRTGQVVTPEYDQLVADVPAEKRPAAVLAKKMASLNANTTASRGGALMAEDVPDFMNQYGDEVAARVMADMPEVHRALGKPLKEGEDTFETADAMRKVTGRIPLLPIEQQEMVYEMLESEYRALIEQKEASGESVLEAKTLDLDAEITERRQVVAPESGDSPFADGVYVETADVKRLGKPHPTDHVIEMVAEEVGVDASTLSADNMEPAVRAGREAAESTLQETEQAFRAYRREVLDELESDDARRATGIRLDGNMERFRSLMQAVPEGQSVKLMTDAGNLYGVVTRIHRTGKAKSPVALGSWKVTVAVTDASRQITIPMSQLFTRDNAPSMPGASHVIVERADHMLEGMPVIRAFDDMQTEARETRTIITGNVLAGFDHVGGRGAIINFTDREGGVRQGILMPRDFQYEKDQQEKPVDFRSAEQVLAFIGRGHAVKSADGAVEVTMSGGRVRFEVASAKARGGRYYLDPGILGAAGSDFVRVGGRMRLEVAQDVAPSVIDEMKRAGAGFRATDDLKVAREIAGSVSGETEGQFSLRDQTDTPEFRRWFGDSKVVDEQGEPLVVYHGTTSDVPAFDPISRGDATGARSAAMGYFFASSREVASSYAANLNIWQDVPLIRILNKATGGAFRAVSEGVGRLQGTRDVGVITGGNVIPVYLSIQNPMEVDFQNRRYRDRSYAEIVQEAKDNGHDGLILRNTYDEGFENVGNPPTDIYVAFEPTQIKSAVGNRGIFDPTDPRITYKLRDDFTRDAEQVTSDLQSRLQELGISDRVVLRLRDRIQAVAEGKASEAEGRYLRRVIEVSMAARDPTATLNHEVIHALRDLGLIRDAEWRTLERAAREDTGRMDSIRERYERLGLSDEAMVEEAVADMYADWAAERGQRRGFVRRAFERIRDFLRALGNVLAGRGYRTADSVFRSVERGEVGRRRPQQPQDRERAPIVPGPQFALSDPRANDPTAKDGTVDRQKATNQWLGAQPLDQAMRLPFHVFGGVNEHGEWKWGRSFTEKAESAIVNAKFSEDGRFHWINPMLESARAGLIDRYGLDPAYVERDRQRGLEQRQLMLQGEEHMRVLQEANVGPEEARVLQAILTPNESGEAAAVDEDMEKLAEPIRNAIIDMGAEAVQLGMISAEAFERNRGSYMHRVYLKHESDQGGLSRFVERMGTRKRKKINGQQYKGRGMWIEVDRGDLMRKIPGFRQAERGHAIKGEKIRVLDKIEHEGQGTLRDIDPVSQRKVLDRMYLPADAAVPEQLGDYVDRGIWEVRGTQGGNMVLWRDFTKAEREKLGQILDARYTIAKTYMVMAHDLATGRFFRDIAMNEDWARSSEPRPDTWKDAQDYTRFWADPSIEWVRVPDTVIPKSRAKRYGALSGKWVRAEIWRDLHELENMQKANWWNTILTQWKLNKTARSPVVHMNNVMSNVVLMDLADVRAIDLVQGIASMIRQDQQYQDARDHGAFGSDIVSQELRRNVLQPILEEIQRDVQGGQETIESKVGVVGKLADAIWSRTKGLDRKMVDLYRMEDEVFRMATYMRKLSLGFEPNQAALEARDQFLNYDIRAPWINAARRSVLPFISYTYRAVPIVARSVALRPWKLAKYATIAYAVSALSYMLEPGDEDEERRSMREHETGHTWIGAPRMIRMPYSDEYGNPVFLDVRRWVPAGDVFDMNQGHSAFPIPAPLQFGGPLMLGAELALNKRSFTGDEIVNDRTDDWWDKSAAIADWGWKSWMPSAAWIPGSWYWERIGNAATGGRDWQGRPYSLREAIPSSFGVKLKPQDVEENMFWKGREFDRVERELKAELMRAHRDYERNLISGATLEKREHAVVRKLENLAEERRRTFEGVAR